MALSGARAIVAGLAATFLLAGCAQTLGSHQASLASLETLRAADVPTMNVGQFSLAPGRETSMDRSVVIRSVVLSSPDDGSFASYLKNTLETDLRAAGKYDPNASLSIAGALSDSHVDSGLSDGGARLAARFALARDGKTVFEKELAVDAAWPSSFVGAIAIPDAINNYSSLYEQLAIKLFQDPDFRAAASASHSSP